MYFSRITGDYAELPVDRSNQLADPDGQHRLLWDFFDADESADRPFLYRRLSSSSHPEFLVVSDRRPLDEVTGFSVEVKSYDPDVDEGDDYRFTVRVNSTVKSNGAYHDIVMNRKHGLKQEGVPRDEWPPEPVLEQKTGRKWLEKRDQKNGFELHENSLKVQSHRKLEFEKRSGNHTVTITTMDLTGLLTVREPEEFRSMLFTGLGRKAVYGCGLMMIQPPESNYIT